MMAKNTFFPNFTDIQIGIFLFSSLIISRKVSLIKVDPVLLEFKFFFLVMGILHSCLLDTGFYFSNISTLVVIYSISIPSSIPQCKKSYEDLSCAFFRGDSSLPGRWPTLRMCPRQYSGGTSGLDCALDDLDSLPIHSVHHWDPLCFLGDSVRELLL